MVICVVVGCSKRSDRDKDVSFHRIPTVRRHYGERELELSIRRREGYLAAISRENIDINDLEKYRICSRHFVENPCVDLWDEHNIDWLPTLNLGHSKRKQLSDSSLARYERAKRRRDDQRHAEEMDILFQQQMESVLLNEVEDVIKEETRDISTELFMLEAATENVMKQVLVETITCMEKEVAQEEWEMAVVDYAESKCNFTGKIMDLQKELTDCHTKFENLSEQQGQFDQHLPFGEQSLVDDDYVHFYTGLPNAMVLKSVFDHVVKTLPVERSTKLSPFQEFMVVMLKLRLNSPIEDLSYRFGVSVSSVSRILLKWLKQMDIRLQDLIIWPEREELQRTMPECFKVSFGTKVAIIIDCFEVFIERPSNLEARACTWSNYKHKNTVKILLGIAPQGVIAFVSESWGGRVSDKYLTEHCGILRKLLPGDVILADRGFDIADSVGAMKARLNIPAFTRGKNQLSALEIEETRTIANVRIHVERVIGNVRQKYPILQNTLPIHFVHKRDGEDTPLVDRIVRVCCALVNVCDSVVPYD